MIENGIARFDIAQEIDQRNLIGSGPRERAHDEVEIGGREPRPTIRTNHRDFIMRGRSAYGKRGLLTASMRLSRQVCLPGAARGLPACVAKTAIW
jgi:hypothetical protein